MGKPPELKTDAVEAEKAKKLIENVKKIAEGSIYVYQWNVDQSEEAPLGLFTDPSKVEPVCDALEHMGATKTELNNNSGFKFNLSTITGFQGSHLELYKTGKMQVKWSKGGKTRKSADFIETAFLDVLDGIAKVLKDPNYADMNANKKKNNNNANSKTNNNNANVNEETGNETNIT